MATSAVEALQLRRRVARGLAETVADKATAQCLDRANELQDEETGYVGYVADRFDRSREWCAVWANYVKNPRKKTIDFPESAGAFAAELPKQVLSAAVAMRARRTAVDAHSELCANELMAVSGAGILAVDLLSLPPLSKTTKGWTVKPRSPLTDAIERVRYPIPRPDDDDDDDASTAVTPAVRISHAIPANLALVDPRPRVAWWDELNQTWTGRRRLRRRRRCCRRGHAPPQLLHDRPRAVRVGAVEGGDVPVPLVARSTRADGFQRG